MLPGFTDTDCRIAEFRSRDLRANAERQRIAAQALFTEANQLSRSAVVHGQLKALARRMSHSLHGIRMLGTAGATRTQMLGVGK